MRVRGLTREGSSSGRGFKPLHDVMKVLHVIPAVSPKYGGPSHALVPMCKALMAAGVDVQIATTDAEPHGHLQVELGTQTEFQGVPAIFFRKEVSESFKYSPGLARWLRQ